MIQKGQPSIVLASGSVTRGALLAGAGLTFVTDIAAIDEGTIRDSARTEGAQPEDAAMLLAEMKARRIAPRHPDALIIAADQILVCDGEWFEKPADLAAARAHLLALRGRTHVLATAVLCMAGGRRVWQHVAQPALTMRTFSDEFLDAYLAAEQEAVLSSVGAYRVEGLGVHLFARIEGDHSAILGLPLLPLLEFLRQHGVVVR